MRVIGPDLPPGSVVDCRPPDGSEWSFDGRVLEGVRFRRIKDGWDWLHFRNCTFVDCEFDRCAIDFKLGATNPDPQAASQFRNCVFTRCDFSNSYLRRVRFESCTFADCNLKTQFRSTDLVNNRFVGVVRDLTIAGHDEAADDTSQRVASVIVGNDFTRADLQGLGLRSEVPVADQLWPAGSNVVVVDRWPDRVAALARRLEADGDSLGLLYWARGNSNRRSTLRQTVNVIRLDDPRHNADTLRAYRALIDMDGAELDD